LVLTLSLLVVFLASRGQGVVVMDKRDFEVTRVRDTGVDRFLSDFPRLKELGTLDQEAFYWVNLLRKDPSRFYEQYVRPFGEQFPTLKGANFSSLEVDCRNAGTLKMLSPAPHLQKEALRHAQDLAKNIGKISHSASDGRNFAQRMADAGVRRCGGENVFEGESEALVALILLLIDEGVPGLGHRKALLNPVFDILGVASEESANGRFFMVQLFSCQ
jgi:Cysteine-rich secretory protein family